MNHEKRSWQRLQKQQGIEWEQKGTHEEHLMFITSRRKSEKGSTGAEQEKEYLTGRKRRTDSKLRNSEQISRF